MNRSRVLPPLPRGSPDRDYGCTSDGVSTGRRRKERSHAGPFVHRHPTLAGTRLGADGGGNPGSRLRHPCPGARRHRPRPPSSVGQRRDAVEPRGHRCVHTVGRHESDDAVADAGHPACLHPRCGERHRSAIRAVHDRPGAGARRVGRGGRCRRRTRGPRDAAARTGAACRDCVRAGSRRRARGGGQVGRHRRRPCRRLGHAEPAAGRRRGHGGAAAIRPAFGARRIPVHAALHVRRSAGLGPGETVHCRSSRAQARRPAAAVQPPLRPRRRRCRRHRPGRQPPADARAVRDRTVLVRGFSPRLESNRQPRRRAARPRSLVGSAHARARQLRDGRRIHRRVRREVPLPLLAARDRHSRGGERRQRHDRRGSRVAAVPRDPSGARLPVDAHGARLGSRGSADRASRRPDAVQRDEPDIAGRDARVPQLLGRGRREWIVTALRRHSLPSRDP